MKKILVISNFVNFPSEGGNDRFIYLMNQIDYDKYNVELITSDFFHEKKEKHSISNKELESFPYKVTFIHEPGYKKNVAIKRLFSHKILANNLKKYLNSMKRYPDIIYCAVPSLSLAKEAAKFAEKNNIKFIIDIQDLWPEAFKMVFNVPFISSIIFYPMKKMANYIYKNADNIVAVSDTYLNRALEVNKKSKENLSVFLGTDLEYFDKCKMENLINFNDDIIRIAYVGTLGSSYNIKLVIDALKILNERGINNLQFVIMGDGPLKQKFENYVKEKNGNCEFMGRLPYEKMVGLLCSCDIAVNPINKGSAGSIINKVGDYAMAGIPVINTQENEEYRKLVEEYKIGFNCENDNIEKMANRLKLLIENEDLRKDMGEKNKNLAIEKFNRKMTYKKILNLL